MPLPYPLHGSGPESWWNAVLKDSVLRAIPNRSPLRIVFRFHVCSMLGPIWEPLGALFDLKIDPSSVYDALPSLIFFKHTMFTKPSNQCSLIIFVPKIDPKRPTTGPQDGSNRDLEALIFCNNPCDRCWFLLGSILDFTGVPFGPQHRSRIDPKTNKKSSCGNIPPRNHSKRPQDRP